MPAAGVLLASILVGGAIAIATGVIAFAGILQVLRGAGIHRQPPVAAMSITARQRAIDARLRARYLARHAPTREPTEEAAPVQVPQRVEHLALEPSGPIVPLVEVA
jgi:hypothetical protein